MLSTQKRLCNSVVCMTMQLVFEESLCIKICTRSRSTPACADANQVLNIILCNACIKRWMFSSWLS